MKKNDWQILEHQQKVKSPAITPESVQEWEARAALHGSNDGREKDGRDLAQPGNSKGNERRLTRAGKRRINEEGEREHAVPSKRHRLV